MRKLLPFSLLLIIGGLIIADQIPFTLNRSLEKACCHFLMTAIRKTAFYMLDS